MAAGMVAGAAVAALMAAVPAAAVPAYGSPAGVAGGGRHAVGVTSEFAPVSALHRSKAVTYEHKKVPVGARISVAQWASETGMTIRLKVQGLKPHRTYGAHVHTKPCGPKPDDSGPHYQNRVDPKQPSVDPAYANPHNEVWLDFTTDAKGNAHAASQHSWWFREGAARSVVIHDHRTTTGPGHAGTAGDRLGCLTVPFAHRLK